MHVSLSFASTILCRVSAIRPTRGEPELRLEFPRQRVLETLSALHEATRNCDSAAVDCSVRAAMARENSFDRLAGARGGQPRYGRTLHGRKGPGAPFEL